MASSKHDMASYLQLLLSTDSLEKIEAPFLDTVTSTPLIQQWASAVIGSSSSRAAPAGTDFWSQEKIIGAPSWWNGIQMGGGINNQTGIGSGSSPVYGDSVQSWCPSSECQGGNANLEWIELSVDEPVYLRRVEVFQNLRPGAVVGIFVFDDPAQLWRRLYQSAPSAMPAQYSTLIPSFCPITTFKTRKVRIELDPCYVPGWHEIEAVRITGTYTLASGVVSNPEGMVLYVPDSTPGDDVVTYTASECSYLLPSASPSFSYSMRILGVTTSPIAYPQTADVVARDWTKILLAAYSPDSSATFQRIISKLPSKGTLYNAAQDSSGHWVPTSKFESEGEVLIDNADGFVFYRATSSCQYNVTSFEYYVSAEGSLSGTATITLNSLCNPSFLNYRRWLAITLLILTLVCLSICVIFGVFVIAKRRRKAIEEDRPWILVFISVAAFVSIATLFFEFAPVTTSWCTARMWVLHLATTCLVAGCLAYTMMQWNDFALQALRSGSSREFHASAMIIPLVAILIEIVQLLIFTIINPPIVHRAISVDNAAVTVATCTPKKFSYLFLLINKSIWLFAVFILAAILLSVALTVVRSAVVMICASVVAIACGIIFAIALASVESADIKLLLNVLVLLLPIMALLSLLSIGKLKRGSVKQSVVETTEFGLQPMSRPAKPSRTKSSSHLSENAANVQMTMSMNNHTVDKSVNALLDTLQDKERQIAVLKRKLLKRHYRIRELQQKLTDTVEGSNMMYSQAAPSEYSN